MRASLQPIDTSADMDLASADTRKNAAKLITRLFELWNLDNATQLNLLGLSETSRSLLVKYRSGDSPLPASRDVRDRVGWLLACHKALRLLYPRNEALRYGWVNRRNAAFNGHTPVEVMRDQGLVGVARVARYLDYLRGL